MLAKVGTAGLLVGLALGTNQIHARVDRTPRVELGEAFVPRPELAEVVALGFDAVVADFYWLQAVQIVGGSANPEAHSTTLGRMVDVVTTLDPWVDHPYRFAAAWLTRTEEDVRLANELLRRGIEHHPDDWRNYFYLGFNHFFYLQENQEAAEVLGRAIELPGVPLYLPRLVARLRSEASGDLTAAVVFLRQLIRDAEDEESRDNFRAALDEIEVEKVARALDRARKAYIQLNGQDITRVEDLVEGPRPVLRALPPPYPPGLPESFRVDDEWVLDFERDVIISTYYGHRYELKMGRQDRERAERWRRQRERAAAAEPGEEEEDS